MELSTGAIRDHVGVTLYERGRAYFTEKKVTGVFCRWKYCLWSGAR